MSKKRWITEILLCSFAISITACATSENSKAEKERKEQQLRQQQQQQVNSDKNITYNLHPERDSTDALAVPSDSTEEEQEEEIQELHSLEKQNH